MKKTTSTKLKEFLKRQKLRLPHGYELAIRKRTETKTKKTSKNVSKKRK